MKEIENDIIKFWIEDGILFSEYKKPIDVTLESAKSIIALRHEISNNQKQYWCYHFTGVKSYPKEVRDYADIHGQEYLHATAAIVTSHVTRFILNTFLKLKTPLIPLQAFKTREDAVAWLKKIKSENEGK